MYMVHLDIQYGVIKDVCGPFDIQYGLIKNVYGQFGYTIRSNQRCIWYIWKYNTE